MKKLFFILSALSILIFGSCKSTNIPDEPLLQNEETKIEAEVIQPPVIDENIEEKSETNKEESLQIEEQEKEPKEEENQVITDIKVEPEIINPVQTVQPEQKEEKKNEATEKQETKQESKKEGEKEKKEEKKKEKEKPSKKDKDETKQVEKKDEEIIVEDIKIKLTPLIPATLIDEPSEITLIFGGDIMAHEENYRIKDFNDIWTDVTEIIESADLAFANIESPIDTTIPVSAYPNFNMSEEYVQAAVDAGFDVFSLCNNHTNDQGLKGMKETVKTMDRIAKKEEEKNKPIYFSGLKDGKDAPYTYNVIEEKGWRILFFPMTEILNRPNSYTDYINYSSSFSKDDRENLFNYIKEIKEKEKCDLFIYSIHVYEPEYIREVTEEQEQYYKDLLDIGVDIIMANHTHLIKNRKVVVDTKTNSDKLIMYANGNVISGQRRKPNLEIENPDLERDNTGDGLLYKVTLKKHFDGRIEILKAEPIFITTYITPAKEFVIKLLDDNFIDYLYKEGRTDWAKYIKRRMKINLRETKDLIEWR